MTAPVTPLPPVHEGGDKRARMLTGGRVRPRTAPSAAELARRRLRVRLAKVLLPVLGLLLLASIALWPEIARLSDRERVTFKRLASPTIDGARIRDARYHGVDDHGQPYTLTAREAIQIGPDRVDLTAPSGDALGSGGNWTILRAHDGVYQPQSDVLDLSGDVTVYRDDGTVLRSDVATIDLKQGMAVGESRVHAEGPFGTLDAQAYALADKGSVVQFAGPARLKLNSGDAPGGGS